MTCRVVHVLLELANISASIVPRIGRSVDDPWENFFCKQEQNGLVSAGFALLVFRRALVSVKVWSTTVPTFTIVSSGVAAIHSWQVRDSWRFCWWCCIPFRCVEVPFLLNFTTFTVWSCFSNSFVCISLNYRLLQAFHEVFISRGLLAELCAVGNLTYSSR